MSLVALIAFVGTVAGVRPCLDDDTCEMTCATASLSCPASSEHQDPEPPTHACDCMCHVPGIAARPDPDVLRLPRIDKAPAVAVMSLRLGFLDSPFRPPRA